MNKQSTYKNLEDQMLNYTDYARIPVLETNESLIPVPATENLYATQYRDEMFPYTGEQVYVRQGVARRLGVAAALLALKDDSLQLEVCYGYRALEIQKKNFETQRKKLESLYQDEELLAMTHRLVAVPEVAGHPAGAAVDIRLTKDNEPLNTGTNIWEFVPDSYTFSPFISQEAKRNRMLLRNVMLVAGFAPYDGEWWHFSYGDKEWARYYNLAYANYGQLDFRTIEPERVLT